GGIPPPCRSVGGNINEVVPNTVWNKEFSPNTHYRLWPSAYRKRRCIVREFLDTTFPQWWIGRGAIMAWSPRSPVITPLVFYLWDYMKQHGHSERINDINHLKQRITDVIHSVTPDVLTRVWEELDYRLDVCRATNGAHIELR
ncbi:hypothetical protein AVEN_39767-1, partial [Araneus ventricosus]